MNDDREIVFTRIREALKYPVIHHESHGHADFHEAHHEGFEAWLPQVGSTQEERIRLFSDQSDALKTEFLQNTEAELPATMAELQTRCGWKSYAWHETDLTNRAVSKLTGRSLRTDTAYDKMDLEKCDVGITGCEALIAQTGSILLSTKTAGGRTLSILPPHHVVVARKDQMLPDLPAATTLIKTRYGEHGESLPSMMCLVTGPSRTGDIERVLVLGAQGPKKLTVILVE